MGDHNDLPDIMLRTAFDAAHVELQQHQALTQYPGADHTDADT